ncbi:MAG: hypothetical protein JSR91_00415 [Proteobacteria bacterium]|nr:hypothetical protein [Pseudomonadota bacterium]
MSSGAMSMAEAWNLQLQGKVQDLELDLAEAERLLKNLTDDMRSSVHWTLARGFLKRMDAKRRRLAEIAADVEHVLRSPQ